MTDLERTFNRKYGAYKGLVTRYENMGYEIEDTYTPPQKITEASFRRLEQAREEIRRQKDVQEARAYFDGKEAYDKIMDLINGYAENKYLGRVGKDDFIGRAGKGDGSIFKKGSQTDLQLAVEEIYWDAKRRPQTTRIFSKNVNDNIDYFEDIIEKFILAVYRKKTAQWSADAGDRWAVYLRMLEAFKGALNRGL